MAPAALQEAYQPFLGKTIDAAGLQKISDAVAAAYARSDVALYTVVIPAQDFAQGVLRIQVTEGFVEGVVIKGAGRKTTRLVKAIAETLTRQRPLRRSSLQRETALIRDVAGLSTSMHLLNGDTPGAVQLELTPDLKPVQLGIAFNNRGTAFLGRDQVEGDLYLNSLFRAGDQTHLTLAAPTDTNLFSYAQVSHSTWLDHDGTVLQITASYLRTRPATTNLVGHAGSLGMQISHPLIRDYENSLDITVGVDGLNADNAFLGQVFSDDRSRAGRLALAFSQTRGDTAFAISGAVSRGIRGLGARTLTPAATDLGFTKVNARVSLGRAIRKRWIVRLNAAGQAADDRLPASEQFALGGAEFGRAYEGAAATGDSGYGASAELAYRPANLPALLSGSEAYGFVDAGEVHDLARAGFAPAATYRLASGGGGVRLTLKSHAVLEIEAARGFANSNPYLDHRSWRGLVSLKSLF